MRVWLGIVVVFCAFGGFAGQAHAHPLLDDAVDLYEAADFARALRTFNTAYRNADLSVEELLQLFEMRALVHRAIGDEEAMLADLRRLAAVRPSYRLGRLAPPPVRKAFQDMLEENGGSLGVELVIEEKAFDGVPYMVARVDQVPRGLVDHTALQCRVGAEDKAIARTAQGSRVRIKLPKTGAHNGCEATAHTRQGGVLFSANVDGTRPPPSREPLQMPEYGTAPSDGSVNKKKKKWPWIVAASVLVVAGGVTAGVVLSQRSNEGSSSSGGVMVAW